MLYKRIVRELKESLGAYLAVAIIITLGLGTVLGGNAGDDSMIEAIEEFQSENCVEDGHFITYGELPEDVIDELQDMGVVLEEAFYYDVETNDTTLRVMSLPKEINLENIEEGEHPLVEDEIWLEKHYAEKNGLTRTSKLQFGEVAYQVTGIGSLPQYIHVLQNVTDLSSDTSNFSLALVSKEGMERLEEEGGIDTGSKVNQYTYLLPEDMESGELKSYLLEQQYVYLLSFLNIDNNPRITDYIADCEMVKKSTFIFAIIFMILMAYVICIFTQNRIEKESAYIGTLYALGYRKSELIRHYLALPVLSVFVGGIGSLAAGKWLFSWMLTQDSIDLYSIPKFSIHMPGYIIAFGLFVPTLITVLVGWIVLGLKLSASPLSLIRGNVRQGLKLKWEMRRVSYVNRYRIRQFFREIVGNIVLIIGLFAATVLLILGCSIYGTITNYAEHTLDYLPYNYLYSLNNEIENAPENGELVRMKNLTSYLELGNVDLDIIMMGLTKESEFFSFTCETQEDEIIISTAVAEKFGLEVGEHIELYDSLEEMTYQFQIIEIVPYTNALHVFMQYEVMEEVIEGALQQAIISDKELEFTDEISVMSTTKAQDYENAANDMLDSLMLFMIALIGSAAAIVALVTYLMLKFMVDKAVFGISMLRIFGYENREVNKIYLGGEFYTVCVSIVLSLLLGQYIVKALMVYLTSGYSAALTMYIHPITYVIMAVFELLVYLMVHIVECQYIAGINYVDILKNRE